MSRLLFLAILPFFAFSVSSVEAASNGNASDQAANKKQVDMVQQMDCSSKDPAILARCTHEISAIRDYLSANNNEAFLWLSRKSSQNPALLRQAMSSCVQEVAPPGEMPSFPDIHRCARKRLGP